MPWLFQGQFIEDLQIVYFNVADVEFCYKSVYFNVEN